MKSQESTFSDIQLENPTGRRNSNPGLHFQLVTPADYIYTHRHGGVYFPFLMINAVNVEASSLQVSISPADLHGMWYPTVRRTLVCLSKLYRCIDVSLVNFTLISHRWCCSFSFIHSYSYLPYCNLVFFQRAVFQGLSQEALSACIQSLLKASDIILKNKVWLTFLIIKHFF